MDQELRVKFDGPDIAEATPATTNLEKQHSRIADGDAQSLVKKHSPDTRGPDAASVFAPGMPV